MSNPLTSAQLSEVRAAVDVLPNDEPWDSLDIEILSMTDHETVDAVVTILNAAPALIEMAEAAAQLKENQERQRKMFARRDPNDSK